MPTVKRAKTSGFAKRTPCVLIIHLVPAYTHARSETLATFWRSPTPRGQPNSRPRKCRARPNPLSRCRSSRFEPCWECPSGVNLGDSVVMWHGGGKYSFGVDAHRQVWSGPK
ncbi:uncharacterized protein CC84DRAFT_953809 [Paraphaeosphaeria sporulosa]|uniref:Uncharacterized protein n=1 Tax=Paraphaeosphaeria sporulosa TaxID=1460663 RepID=A0A177C878_9PLEO|nr:uncharacterized protein CC84DRAFT_953809 [Paraphaeosphaeria sporulosa]OAG03059.1 hypothetical protein CC84DRAFT_953809 [Paraphaeosphaeria sporulosa]